VDLHSTANERGAPPPKPKPKPGSRLQVVVEGRTCRGGARRREAGGSRSPKPGSRLGVAGREGTGAAAPGSLGGCSLKPSSRLLVAGREGGDRPRRREA